MFQSHRAIDDVYPLNMKLNYIESIGFTQCNLSVTTNVRLSKEVENMSISIKHVSSIIL